MERQIFEPITQANLTEIGDSELENLIKFYKKRLEKYPSTKEADVSSQIILTLENELVWRNKIKSIKCPWLLLSGKCRNKIATDKYSTDHECPMLSGKPCTVKRIQSLSKF